MDEDSLDRFLMGDVSHQICPMTGLPIKDPAVFHRDLSDNWPKEIHDIRDERLRNIMIVEWDAREEYYKRLKKLPVVLSFSGGLDSATVLHWCTRIFGSVHCLVFDYGQRHSDEIDFALDYVKHNNFDCLVSCKIIEAEMIKSLASSSLTRSDINPPENSKIDSTNIPNTFVPGRNLFFITAIAQKAYEIGTRHIALGVNAIDYSGYPDCRPEFIDAMKQALTIGVFNNKHVHIHTPLITMTKAEIIKMGMAFQVKYEKTHSCYNGVLGGCGKCDSCQIRRNAFKSLGFIDPSIAEYKNGSE